MATEGIGPHFLSPAEITLSRLAHHVSSSRLQVARVLFTHSRGDEDAHPLHSRRFFFAPSHQLPTSHQPPGFQKLSQGAAMAAEGNAPSLAEVGKPYPLLILQLALS
jgi:hypothetical protein